MSEEAPRRSWFAGLVVAATAMLVAACGGGGGDSAAGGEREPLTFAAIPAESSQSLESTHANIVELLQQETGVEVEFENVADYAAVVEGMRAGQIDIAGFGPFTYVLAKDSGVPVEPVAAPADTSEGPPTYTSRLYTTPDSGIDSVADLAGRNVCFVDVGSTSGYLVPYQALVQENLDIDEDLNAVMTGGHDASLLGLAAGDCDAAFAQDTMIDTLTESGQLAEGEIEEIWVSEEIVEYPIAVNTETIAPELREQVSTTIRDRANKPALVQAGVCEIEQDCALPEETGWGYLPVEDSDFDFIRQICEDTQAEACQAI